MTTTTYSDVTLTTLAGFVQENLRGRVSKITYDVNGDNVPEYSSFFSYDVHGNVKTLIQKDNTLGFKRMDYYYDLISGNVKDIVYQTGKPDRFYHKYYYDADNRITSVQTSHDSIIWDKDASYFYYRHGPLARTELGDKKVQGLDYAYTLQGWLKGVNSNQVSPDYDQGKDGKTGTQYNTGLAGENANVASDVFGYSLGYFDPFSGYTIQKTSPFQNISINANGTDYQSADASKTFLADISPLTQVYNYVAGSTTSYSSQAPNLYNGNIKHMVTSIWEDNGSGGGAIQPQLTAYNYDQLNRITNMHGYRDLNASTNQWNNTVSSTGTYGDAFKTSYTYDANGNIKTLNRADVDGDDFDQLDYKYDERVTAGGTTKLESNKLYTVIDPAPPLSNTPTQTIEDIKTMTAFVPYDAANPATFKNNNFYYDEIGNLIQDKSSHIANIDWNAYGKIRKITFDDESSDLAFEYDASGNRTAKIEQKKDQSTYSVLAPTEWKYTYYVHDAKGNIMSVYEKNPTLVVGGAANNLIQTQVPIYGSSRIGLFDPEVDLTATTSVSSTFARRFLKQKQYELTNHLGNVLTTISDRKLKNSGGAIAYSAEIISAQDYYPFGMIMPGRNFNADKYRFGFNGKEMDDEVKGMGNSLDFANRVFEPRLGKFLGVDPLNKEYCFYTPYQYAGNNPIYNIDIEGLEETGYSMYLDKVFSTPKSATKFNTEMAPLRPFALVMTGVMLGTTLAFIAPEAMPYVTKFGPRMLKMGAVGGTVNGTISIIKGESLFDFSKNVVAGFCSGAVLGTTFSKTTYTLLTNGAISGAIGEYTKQLIDNEYGGKNGYKLKDILLSAGIGGIANWAANSLIEGAKDFVNAQLAKAIANTNTPEYFNMIKAAIQKETPSLTGNALNQEVKNTIKQIQGLLEKQGEQAKVALKQVIENSTEVIKDQIEDASKTQK